MNRYPGFEYDAEQKRARFDCYVPGTSGRSRRRRTVSADTRAEALRLWREFVDELAAAGTTKAADEQLPTSPPQLIAVPTLKQFVEDHYETIAAGFKPSTRRSHGSIIKNRLLPVFGDEALDAFSSVSLGDFMVTPTGAAASCSRMESNSSQTKRAGTG